MENERNPLVFFQTPFEFLDCYQSSNYLELRESEKQKFKYLLDLDCFLESHKE